VTEESYFIQVLVIANVVFGILFADRLRMILADPGSWWRPAAIVVFTNFLWGFHQELVYRGILQTELVRRWGSLLGILVSNLLFTFGPLHLPLPGWRAGTGSGHVCWGICDRIVLRGIV